ncbi:aminotransferase class V-fold PLP-dependent enzyme [Mariniflexile soesokkakense]|uniref:Aminotransferase class V-fold PLP-dependent enzyme n=1 Tax=Mariniflexile soesokkakense TaxID=1343160 RepID=A0ABV0AF88_9FLAO
MKPSIQSKLFLEMKDKTLLYNAQHYAFEYLDEVFDRNVFPTKEALLNLSNFDEELPESSTSSEAVLRQLNTYGKPATVATLGGRYFGFVTGSALPIGLAAKHLATYWDQAPAMHVLSPIGSKLESVVEKWLIDLFNLPTRTSAGFVSGTSSANLCGLAAARYRILKNQNWDVNKQGLMNAPKIRIVAGRHAHSTVLKAIGILGLGQDAIEWVDGDSQGRMKVDEIPDLDCGTIVILQAGNVNSGAFDDFDSICSKAQIAGAWVHIDGAFGLWAQAVSQLKHLTKGIEKANSWAVDGHKTLNTPYDCGIVMCEDSEAMTAALHMTGSYIIQSAERDGMFYTPEMSRRARIIELWATLKYLGKNGIDEMILNMHERAKQFATEIKLSQGFTIDNDIVFNQVIVRCESDAITEQVLKNVQELRECWAGGSVWFGNKVIRVSVCSWATTPEEITRSVKSFYKAIMMCQTKSNEF